MSPDGKKPSKKPLNTCPKLPTKVAHCLCDRQILVLNIQEEAILPTKDFSSAVILSPESALQGS